MTLENIIRQQNRKYSVDLQVKSISRKRMCGYCFIAQKLYDDCSFEPEQKFFGFNAARIADERTVGTEDAMTGDDDRKRVGAVCAAHCLKGIGCENLSCQGSVRNRRAVRYFYEFFPNANLVRCSDEIDRACEFRQFAVKISCKLVDNVFIACPVVSNRFQIEMFFQPVKKIFAGFPRNAYFADATFGRCDINSSDTGVE